MNFDASFSASLQPTMNDILFSSPTKRRKIKGAFAMKPKKVSITWPPGAIPVEIFTMIIRYLPRSNILNMRLVNKEFDQKVAEFLFRVVVVPFRPEIYGISAEKKVAMGTKEVLHGSIMLQDRGMRVFEGFGPHIKKFAMSFEIDHVKLAYPPLKNDQEAITSFWGIYPWPHKDYNRYTQLEGLEQTADETKTMQEALKYVNKAEELGISIDGGLGWLAGPDINERVFQRGEIPAVFGSARFMPEPKARSRQGRALRAGLGDLESSVSTTFERMLQEAGYTGASLQSSIRLMIESQELRSEPESPAFTPTPPFSAENTAELSANRRRYTRALHIAADDMEDDESAIGGMLSDDESTLSAEEQEAQGAVATTSNRAIKLKADTYPLKPNNLTNAQREMLLEMEWAQSAFITSFMIAIIDNTSTFARIKTLTIARIPHGHLSKLKRRDFWDSLPNLKSLSLAVIPDWRKVRKEATGWVQDDKVFPSDAVSVVHDILLEHISQRQNITTLHFEWLCGGEYSPGIFSRNQHILTAPFVANARLMVDRAQVCPVLTLTHVQHLSLKNCWISPHVMSKALIPLKSTIQSLKFDSVSLTAPIPSGYQPRPPMPPVAAQNVQVLAGQAAANNLLMNFPAAVQNLQNGVLNGPLLIGPVVQADALSEPDWLQAPSPGSWSHFIDVLTPGITLADIRHSKDMDEEPEPRKSTSLTKLKFTSCGYVRLPLDFDQTALDPIQPGGAQAAAVTKRFNEFEGLMMKSADPFLATIVNHMTLVEVQALENAWNMNVGWRLSRPELAADAALDGAKEAGNGRFEGTIEVLKLP